MASVWRAAEIGRPVELEPEGVDRDRLRQAAGVDREDRRRGVGDHHVQVLRLGRPEAAFAERELEQRLDLLLVQLGGPERVRG